MLALGTDVFECAVAVQDTAGSALPHKGYANARLAFEGAQNLLVLATHEEYEAAGALAWVYFESKDANWRASAEERKNPAGPHLTEGQWLEQRISQIANVWDSNAKGKGRLLLDALARVRGERKKRPDNWLHENMAARQHRAYTVFALSGAGRSLAATAELNEQTYHALCRVTHARPRFDSFAIIRDQARGIIRVDVLPRNFDQARYAVTTCTTLSVREAVAALRWQRTGTV
ncbi:MAG: hypothetical protein HY508_08255 [Acidobacteria bacterium]|nr:hypothetical protein [Acidobacteriota bacterium]